MLYVHFVVMFSCGVRSGSGQVSPCLSRVIVYHRCWQDTEKRGSLG